VRRLDLQS